MSIFKNLDWSFKSVVKVIGVVLLGVIALGITVSLLSFILRTMFGGGGYYDRAYKGYDDFDYAQPAYELAEEASFFGGGVATSRIASPPFIPEPSFSTGTDAEDFEVQTYSGTIETRKLDETCEKVAALKRRTDVIFEDSNKNDNSCYYRFKVEKEKTEEIVAVIEGLDPEILNVNTQSIKKRIEGVEDELDILKKKLASVEETLDDAQDAYDEISQLATRQQDAETLAKIIDSKLNLIERLSNQRLQIREQIDRYNERKADQLDRLDFTFFNVNVFEDLIFDWEEIKDNWKYELKELVRNVNQVFQDITLSLVTYLLRFAQVIIYLFITLFILKFVWVGMKKLWKGKKRK